jgi:hypothetical protein
VHLRLAIARDAGEGCISASRKVHGVHAYAHLCMDVIYASSWFQVCLRKVHIIPSVVAVRFPDNFHLVGAIW